MDAGGTSTQAGLYDGKGRLLAEAAAGPANPVAYGLNTCLETLAAAGRELLSGRDAPLMRVAAAVSGARDPELRETIARRLFDELSPARAVVTDDLRPLLYANARAEAAVLAIAGTGSSVLAQADDGRWVLVGGRGAVVGDEGSAYRIAVEALRAAAHAMDGLGPETVLTDLLPEAAGAASFAVLPGWADAAPKRAMAELAQAVTRAAEEGDVVAAECVRAQAARLAEQTVVAAERLSLAPNVCVYLSGGLFFGSPLYRERFEEIVTARLPHVRFALPRYRGHRAVAELALAAELPPAVPASTYPPAPATPMSPTEMAAADRVNLDELSAEEIVRAMNGEDVRAAEAVGRAAPALAAVVEAAADAIASGGRIIYAGAGTSGRLAVLDAAECPPTFGVDPERVVALLAGGEAAQRNSVEGAEDDAPQGAADVEALGPGENDLVVGVAASGTTPYVRAVLETARSHGAKTVLLCCNPYCQDGADIVIVLNTGPEILPGSTRLKAGTATKMALNIISTGAMALSGYVYLGLMVNMRPVNEKLRRRAVRIVCDLTGAGPAEAAEWLEEADCRIPVAVLMGRLDLDAAAAAQRLEESGGNLREALREDR